MLKLVIDRKGRGDKKGVTTTCCVQDRLGKSYSHTVHGIKPKELNELHIALESFVAGLDEDIRAIEVVRSDASVDDLDDVFEFTSGQLKVLKHIRKIIKWE